MSFVIECLACIVECAIIVRFCNNFLGFKNEKFSTLKSFCLFVLLSTENCVLSAIPGCETLLIVLLMLIIFIYSMLFLKGKIIHKILIANCTNMILLPINMISLNAFKLFFNCTMENLGVGGSLRFLLLFVSQTSFFLVCELILKVKRKKDYLLTGFQWIIQFLCFIISSVIAFSLWNIAKDSQYENNQFLLIYIMIAILNVLLFVLLNKMEKNNIINEENRIIKLTLDTQKQLVTNAQEQYSQMKILRHDMKHCLTTTAGLLENNEVDRAKGYIESILKQKIDAYAIAISTDNPVIDAVINSKLSVCQNKGIRTKCQIDITLGNINEIDFSILVSNLFDNAIEGCKGVEEPIIEFTISRQKSFLYVIVKNTIASSVLSENPNLLTSKDNKLSHGFGVKSIRELTKKYDGTLDFNEEGNLFVVEISLVLTD